MADLNDFIRTSIIAWEKSENSESQSFYRDGALYVDDLLVVGKSEKRISEVKENLKAFHPMKGYGRAARVLGMRLS